MGLPKDRTAMGERISCRGICLCTHPRLKSSKQNRGRRIPSRAGLNQDSVQFLAQNSPFFSQAKATTTHLNLGKKEVDNSGNCGSSSGSKVNHAHIFFPSGILDITAGETWSHVLLSPANLSSQQRLAHHVLQLISCLTHPWFSPSQAGNRNRWAY